LLVFLVPPAHNQHEHRSDAGLKKAEEEALGVKPAETLHGSCTHQGGTPDHNYATTHALNRESLSQKHCRKGASDVADVENRGGERITIPNAEVKIVSEAENRLSRSYLDQLP